MDSKRKYEQSHPHITFRLDLSATAPSLWALLGEAKSKSEHVGQALLTPEASQELMRVYVAKGVLATTAIEGNTLSEEEVRQVLDGQLKLPPSREYLQREVENVLAAYNNVRGEILATPELPHTLERLRDFNRQILDGLELEEGVIPGEIRSGSVVVGPYKAAPAEDCEYLVERLCEWLNGPDFDDAGESHPELRAPLAIVKAIIAHLYFAWIHPFGDGNGRTARLLELQILMQAGFPVPTCQLLSNHYNQTRTDYYRRLDAASRADDELGFLHYAARGFVDQLREQLAVIWKTEFEDRWEHFVYQRFGERHGETANRRRRLVLAVSHRFQATGEPVSRDEIVDLNPKLAAAYATKTRKTLTRDLNAVRDMELLRRGPGGWEPMDEVIRGLRPPGAPGVLDT
jgi:Fic family protein